MEKILVRYFMDCRGGELEGVFVCTKEELEDSYGRNAYFGEVLGKHSEVTDDLTEDSFEIIPCTQEQIETIVKVFGSGVISGYCPFDYI